MRNLNYIFFLLFILSGAVGHAEDLATGESVERVTHVLAAKSKEEIKRAFPSSRKWREAKWTEVRFKGVDYIFCVNDVSISSHSRINLHGWVYRPTVKQRERVFLFQTEEVGHIILTVDTDAGMLVAKGNANNRLNGKEFLRLNLYAM